MLNVLIAVLPVFVSVIFVGCLKINFKSPRKENRLHDGHSEVYEKTKVTEVKPVENKKVKENKVKPPKKSDGSGKKPKKHHRFFIFPAKDEDSLLKTAKSEELSSCSTQKTNDDSKTEEEITLLTNPPEIVEKERLGNLKLIPSPDQKVLAKLRYKAKRRKYYMKSPEDVNYSEEEDSLYNVPSLHLDPHTLESYKSRTRKVSCGSQDSLILRVDADRTIVADDENPAPRSQFAYPVSPSDSTIRI